MVYVAGYVSILVVFGVIEAVWLSTMGPLLYRPTLGDILLTNLRVAPAVVFYLMYPVGILVFASLPALRADAMMSAVWLGLLFGGIAYATYDLTNFATLRNWTLQITVIDIVYGAVVTAIVAAVGFLAMRATAGWLGQA
jgi:uncharacterized membrane protein